MIKVECTEIEKSKLIVAIMASAYCPIDHEVIDTDDWENICSERHKYGDCNGCLCHNIQWDIVEEGVEVEDDNN